MEKQKITVSTVVDAPVEKVWEYFNTPEHVTKWNHASDDWHSPTGTSDVEPGGTFSYRMEAKDGSTGFDFSGKYDEVVLNERISYTMNDGRTVVVVFTPEGQRTEVTETFETENQNSVEMQRDGWQAILNNFKEYTEEN